MILTESRHRRRRTTKNDRDEGYHRPLVQRHSLLWWVYHHVNFSSFSLLERTYKKTKKKLKKWGGPSRPSRPACDGLVKVGFLHMVGAPVATKGRSNDYSYWMLNVCMCVCVCVCVCVSCQICCLWPSSFSIFSGSVEILRLLQRRFSSLSSQPIAQTGRMILSLFSWTLSVRQIQIVLIKRFISFTWISHSGYLFIINYDTDNRITHALTYARACVHTHTHTYMHTSAHAPPPPHTHTCAQTFTEISHRRLQSLLQVYCPSTSLHNVATCCARSFWLRMAQICQPWHAMACLAFMSQCRVAR